MDVYLILTVSFFTISFSGFLQAIEKSSTTLFSMFGNVLKQGLLRLIYISLTLGRRGGGEGEGRGGWMPISIRFSFSNFEKTRIHSNGQN